MNNYSKKRINTSTKIFIIAIIIIFALTMFLSIELNTFSLGVEIGNTNNQYPNVMSGIKNITLANPCYKDLAMISSHDAATSKLNTEGIFDPVEKGGLIEKNYSLIKGIQYRYGVTQTIGLYQQLMQGSRMLQIKCSYYNGDWYTSHCTLGDKLSNEIIEILKFLEYCSDKQYGEIVTVNFRPTALGEDFTGYDLQKYITDVTYNGKSLKDYVHYAHVDISKNFYEIENPVFEMHYNELTNNGTTPSVILASELNWCEDETLWEKDKILAERNYFNPLGFLVSFSPWFNRTSTTLLYQAIDDYILERISRPGDRFIFEVHASLTFRSFQDAMAVINNWSLLKIAEKTNAWLIKDKDKFMQILDLAKIIQIDYINSNYKDFNNRVNKLIKDYNENLVADMLK